MSTVPKKKLSISPCDQHDNGDATVRSGDAFEVMLNPSAYSYEGTICYSKTTTIGQNGSEARFGSIGPATVSFNFVIDGTGVVSSQIPGLDPPDVKTQLQKLSRIVYEYDGKNHEPNVVRLLWGSLIFFCRLTAMKTDYSLFKPSGDPIRATVTLSFKGFMSAEEQALRSNRSSPDLSHRVLFRQGDTLPLLCYRIYKDSSYYAAVARYNDLIDFRDIEPGTEISFPPLA